MIITIRGTSGSGKSTLVRRIMNHYNYKNPVYIPGRKQPHHYDLYHIDEHGKDYGTPLRVLGHYETPTGGGDTLAAGLDYINGHALEAHRDGFDCIFEGLVVSSDFRRAVAMANAGVPIMVVCLNTPLDECIASVETRRRAKGNDKPLNPKATVDKWGLVDRMVARFRAEGVHCEHLNREDAYQKIKEVLAL